MYETHQKLKDSREGGKDLERQVGNIREMLDQETVSLQPVIH